MNKPWIFAVLGAVLLLALYIYVFPISQTVQIDNQAVFGQKKTAMFANGCFWCAEADFEKLPGVVSVVSGYADGGGENPTYQDYGERGFREVVQVEYDSARVSYTQLVEYMIKHGDPTDSGGAFYDRGYEYSPGVYYATPEEKLAAERVIAEIDAKKIFNKPLALTVLPPTAFWPAEEYHQDYYKKNPIRYAHYRQSSGRDAFIEKHWGADTLPTQSIDAEAGAPWKNFVKPTDEELRALLTPIQYNVTQEEGTEASFQNEYDANKTEGIYVDIVSGEPLFSSIDKYDSGTGWPSFTKPLAPENIALQENRGLLYVRTEVRSRHADSHLGHVFNDGPPERGGLRYCMNSAALRFIPKEKLVLEGYGEYLPLFK